MCYLRVNAMTLEYRLIVMDDIRPRQGHTRAHHCWILLLQRSHLWFNCTGKCSAFGVCNTFFFITLPRAIQVCDFRLIKLKYHPNLLDGYGKRQSSDSNSIYSHRFSGSIYAIDSSSADSICVVFLAWLRPVWNFNLCKGIFWTIRKSLFYVCLSVGVWDHLFLIHLWFEWFSFQFIWIVQIALS